MKIRFLSLLFVLVVAPHLFSQPENAKIEMVDGKKCYIHIVQGGNTLYGIQKLYNVSVDEILKANPKVENGLQEGQLLVIPIVGNASLERNLAIHKVEPKETLYGIAKKYNSTPEELTALNPGIQNGVNVGQEIKVPINTPSGSGVTLKKEQQNFKVSFTDTIINHEVQKGETLYSLSKRFMVTEAELKRENGLRNDRIRPGDVLRIPIKKEKVEKVEIREIEKLTKSTRKIDSLLLFRKKEEYKIALLMPLNLDEDKGNGHGVTDMAAEFYMGAKMAINKLEERGLKAKVYVFDSKNDTANLTMILKKPEMQGVDFIIGPFYGNMAGIAGEWCKQKGVRMFCPFSTNYQIMENNPYIFETVSSDVTLAQGLANYILKTKAKEQIILVKTKNPADQAMYDAFRAAFIMDPRAEKVKLIETDLENFQTFASGKTNLICLTNSKSTGRTLVNNISKYSNKFDNNNLAVYTTKDIALSDEISGKNKNAYSFHFVTPHDFSYDSETIKEFHKLYRQEYNADMTKMSAQGYDVMLMIGQEYLLQKNVDRYMMNKFDFIQKGEGSGFENKNGYLYHFDNYDIVKVATLYE